MKAALVGISAVIICAYALQFSQKDAKIWNFKTYKVHIPI